MGIIAAVWLLIFAGSFIIFMLIVPLPNVLPGSAGMFLTAVLKVGLSALLTAIWIYVMLMLRNIYVRRRILSHREDG